MDPPEPRPVTEHGRPARRRRLAAALVVTGRVADEIDGLRRALGASALRRIAPHVTLVPPVNVREDLVPEALGIVREAAASVGPVRLGLGPPETFFPEAPVVYLGVSGDLPALDVLRRGLLRGALDVPRERTGGRPFVPHCTLDQRIDPVRIPAAMAALADYRAEVVFECLDLLEYDASARRWSTMAAPWLGTARVAGRGGLEVSLEVAGRLDPAVARWVDEQWDRYTRETYGSNVGPWPYEPFAVVGREAGDVVGVAEGELRGPTCRLGRLIVDPAHRSLGVGAHLLRATERLAAEHGCVRVRLETIDGGAAERFYERHGYRRVVRLPEWREDRDFVLMERATHS